MPMHAGDFESRPEAFVDEIIAVIEDRGVVTIDGVFTARACDDVRTTLESCLKFRRENEHYWGNIENQVLDNYFADAPDLLDLIYQPLTDAVMRRLIDDDYVLISPSARNRRRLSEGVSERKTSGVGWHTDSRFIQGGKGLRPSLSYMSIIMIDRFGAENGATPIVPGSHKRYCRPDDREADLPHELIQGDVGSLAIFDTALWHRVGEPTSESRWGVFNTYGPWFMKPYHRFNEMFSAEQADSMRPIIRQLLHYDSHPPRDHNESMITLRRVRERVEGK